jgi:hypothetical protein
VGRIESIDETHVVATIGAARAAARLVVRRDAVRRMVCRESAPIFIWAGGQDDWRQVPSGTWREGAGRLTNTAPRSTLLLDLEAGPRSRYDISLSWQQRPTMRLAVGPAGVAARGAARGVEQTADPGGYSVELRPDGIVAVREEPGPEKAGNGYADLQPCGDLPENGLKLAIFIDEEAGRLAVMLPDAVEPIADITLPPTGRGDGQGGRGGQAGQAGQGLRLAVVEGTVAIDALRVSPWGGGPLSRSGTREGSIRLRDGGVFTTAVVGMTQDSGRVVFGDVEDPADASRREVSLNEIEEIRFPAAADTLVRQPDGGGPFVQATDLFGSRLRGTLLRVEQGIVWLGHPAIEGPVPLPIATLATLAAVADSVPQEKLPGRIGRIITGQTACLGCLVRGEEADGDGEDAGHGVAWRPVGSLTASPLAPAAGGAQPRATIEYAALPPAESVPAPAEAIGGIGGHIGSINGRPAVVGLIAGSAAERAGLLPGEVMLAIAPRGDGRFVETAKMSLEETQHLLRGRVGSSLQLRLQASGREPREVALVRQEIPQLGRNPQVLAQALQAHDRLLPPAVVHVDQDAADWFGSLLILRTGETLPCRVEAIDEEGVRVRLPGGEPVTVAADLVQAVELLPTAGRPIPGEKFRSLTMLPRSQRHRPPTHLLRSVEGDYLRGRLLAMDARTIRIAIDADPRGTPLVVPRADVARLIWLHPETLDADWVPPQPLRGRGLLVESVSGGDARLEMMATGVDGNLLTGSNAVIGPCRIDLEAIDRLLVGGEVEASPGLVPYSQWKLEPAPEPRNLPKRRP